MPSTAPIKVPIIGVDQYTKQFNKMVKNARKVGQAITSVGRTMTAAVTLPIIGIGVASAKISRDLNKSLANVGTLIPGQTAKLQDFRKEILNMSVEFATGSGILSEGLYQTISAVGDTANVMDVLKISTMAAKAGVSEVKDSVNLLTKVSTAYGDTSTEMIQKVSDLSFLAVKLGVTTFPELAASMGEIASTAQSMGVSVNELYADTAALTKVLGGTAQAATAMDAVMGELMRGSGDLDKAFKKMHVSGGAELIQKFGGLTGALQALKKHAGGTEIQLKQLFGRKEAMKAAGLLTGSLAQIIVDNKKQMMDASGATAEAFKEQTSGIDKVGFSFDQTAQRVKKLGVQIGDRLLPAVNRFLDKIDPLIQKIMSMSDESMDSAIKFAALAATIGPVLIVVGKTTVAVSSLVKVLGNGHLTTAIGNATAAMGKATTAAGGLNVALGVVAAGVAGWTIGTIIHDQIIEPLMKASQAANVLNDIVKKDMVDPNKKDKAASVLESRLKDAEKRYQQQKEEYNKSRFEAQIRGVALPEKSEEIVQSEKYINELRDLISKKRQVTEKAPKQSRVETVDMSKWTPESNQFSLQTLSLDAVKKMQENNKMDAVVRIAFDNMPPGMNPKVKSERGGKVKVNTPKGAIMAEGT